MRWHANGLYKRKATSFRRWWNFIALGQCLQKICLKQVFKHVNKKLICRSLNAFSDFLFPSDFVDPIICQCVTCPTFSLRVEWNERKVFISIQFCAISLLCTIDNNMRFFKILYWYVWWKYNEFVLVNRSSVNTYFPDYIHIYIYIFVRIKILYFSYDFTVLFFVIFTNIIKE